jgi:hypothetical protein
MTTIALIAIAALAFALGVMWERDRPRRRALARFRNNAPLRRAMQTEASQWNGRQLEQIKAMNRCAAGNLPPLEVHYTRFPPNWHETIGQHGTNEQTQG